MPGKVVKFAPVPQDDRLHQGEILVGLVRVRQAVASIGAEQISVDEISHPFLIVVTQDCDLAQDADARQSVMKAANAPDLLNDPEFRKAFDGAPRLKIENVLICEAMATDERKEIVPPGKDIWKRITQNKDERYQCLEAAPAECDTKGQGIPSISCDFKRYLTIPADELYRRIELAQVERRTRLVTPYAEHLLQRFFSFQTRIPLPENHSFS